MTPTDFAVHVTTCLTHYLAAPRHLSPNTLNAYREVFPLLLRSCRDVRGMAVLLRVLYDTGARVQALLALSAGEVRLAPPAQVRLLGKGRKRRAVPLMEATVQLLRDQRHEHGLDRPAHGNRPLFQHRQGERLSRSGAGMFCTSMSRRSTVRLLASRNRCVHTA